MIKQFLMIFSAVAILGPVLAGCSTAEKEQQAQLVCPDIRLVKYADVYPVYQDWDFPDDVMKESEAVIEGYNRACEYDTDRKKIAVDIDLKISASLGPAAFGQERPMVRNYPYFIALVNTREDIISREAFDADITFPAKAIESAIEEPLRLEIPAPAPDAGGNYTVLLGFELSREQLAHNKGDKKL